VVCEFFTWWLFQRDGVFYADGRTGEHDLGKRSLGTRDRGEALSNLRRLDRQMAVERGLASPASADKSPELFIADDWHQFLAGCERPQVTKGVSRNTYKRYKAVRDKHVSFCKRRGPRTRKEITNDSLKSLWRLAGEEGLRGSEHFSRVDADQIRGPLADRQRETGGLMPAYFGVGKAPRVRRLLLYT
jgi:hypothetical protein